MPPRQLFRPHSSADRAPRIRRIVATLMAVPSLVPSISSAQLAGAVAEPQRLDAPWGLRLSPQIEDQAGAPSGAPAVFVLGDQTSGTADRDIAAKGAAELRRGAAIVKGDALHYDEDTDMADAYGNVRIVNSGVFFAGPQAHLQIQSSQGSMSAPKYKFTQRGGSGSGEHVTLLDSERSVFTDGTYTACSCEGEPAWYIRGSRFNFDTGASEGTARNAVVFFQGLPIFASPWLSFPLSNDRRSGLLPPLFSMSSRNGFELSLPYYFNIAPNRDLTLTPRLISKRGVQMQAAFRYLSPTYAGSFAGEYLPDDALKHRSRYSITWQHTQNLGNGFGAYVNYNKVSDNTYSQDLASAGNQFMIGTQILYQQEAGITYNNGPWSVLARELHWQSLDDASTPYGREPQLNIRYTKYNVGGFDFGAEADYSRFRITTANSTDGDRLVFNPYISYGVVGPGYFVVPKLQMHFASYNLTNVASNAPRGQPKNFTESIPTFSFDTGLIFDRSVRLFGQNFIQTLEPRLYYVYTPYRNQDFAPLFDTAEADFGLAEIFTPNTFVGNDRIADANRITAALTTRFIDVASGDERARFLIAQQYYFRDQRVTLEPGSPTASAKHSDLIAGASIKLGAGFASQTAFQYNADNNRLVRASAGFGFSPEERKVINVAYRYTKASPTLFDEPISQFLISAQWPITRRIYGVGRFNYDMTGHRIVDALVGFQYDADCWTLGVGLQRYSNGVNARNQTNTDSRFLAQLTLKGLANIDNGLLAAFSAGVAGYAPPPPPAPALSRYSDYE